MLDLIKKLFSSDPVEEEDSRGAYYGREVKYELVGLRELWIVSKVKKRRCKYSGGVIHMHSVVFHYYDMEQVFEKDISNKEALLYPTEFEHRVIEGSDSLKFFHLLMKRLLELNYRNHDDKFIRYLCLISIKK